MMVDLVSKMPSLRQEMNSEVENFGGAANAQPNNYQTRG